MKHSVESNFRKGRGFGGTGFLYNKKFSNSITPLVQYKHERVSALKLSNLDQDIILINGYLPYYKVSDLQNHLNLYQEAIAYIENIMVENASCTFILLMDMNCNLYHNDHPYTKLLRDLMRRRSLVSAFDLLSDFDPSANYTRCNRKLGSYTLIDGILISESIVNLVSNVRISHDGDNVSDHSLVEIDVSLALSEIRIPKKIMKPTVMWNKLSQESILLYRETMNEKLDNI